MDFPPPFSRLSLELHERHAVISLIRPARLNTLSRATLSELSAALSSLSRNPRLRAIIVAGSEGAFSVGADLDEVAQLDPASALEFSRLGQGVFASLRESAALTVAAIDGHCIGGGLDLALSCSRRLATPRSTFQHPGARRGIITGWGGTALLARLVGRAHALRMLLTAEKLTAEQALAVGLIDEICADVVERAAEIASANF
jgi:enoyl-CoA hydratase